jgi:hypothetical protein
MGAAGVPRPGMGARIPHHLARPARQWQGEAVATLTPTPTPLSVLELKEDQPVAELRLYSNLRLY